MNEVYNKGHAVAIQTKHESDLVGYQITFRKRKWCTEENVFREYCLKHVNVCISPLFPIITFQKSLGIITEAFFFKFLYFLKIFVY